MIPEDCLTFDFLKNSPGSKKPQIRNIKMAPKNNSTFNCQYDSGFFHLIPFCLGKPEICLIFVGTMINSIKIIDYFDFYRLILTESEV